MSDKTCETEPARARPKASQTFKGARISCLKKLQNAFTLLLIPYLRVGCYLQGS